MVGVTTGLMTGLLTLTGGGHVRGFDHPSPGGRHGQDNAGDEHCRVRCRRSPGRRVLQEMPTSAVDEPIGFVAWPGAAAKLIDGGLARTRHEKMHSA